MSPLELGKRKEQFFMAKSAGFSFLIAHWKEAPSQSSNCYINKSNSNYLNFYM